MATCDWPARSWEVQPKRELILDLCSEHNLVITNTIFKRMEHQKTTWMHPVLNIGTFSDYIIVRQVDQNDNLRARSKRGADSSTDHLLLRSTFSFSIRKKHSKTAAKPPCKLM